MKKSSDAALASLKHKHAALVKQVGQLNNAADYLVCDNEKLVIDLEFARRARNHWKGQAFSAAYGADIKGQAGEVISLNKRNFVAREDLVRAEKQVVRIAGELNVARAVVDDWKSRSVIFSLLSALAAGGLVYGLFVQGVL